MKKVLIIFLLIFTVNINSQEKKDWFYLLESGFNEVNSNNKTHFGIGAEYFISSSSSLTFRLKYLKSGINFYSEGNTSSFPLTLVGFTSKPSRRLLYEGSFIKIPVNYKWEKPLFSPNFKFFINTGIVLNITTEDNFIEIKSFIPSESTSNLSLNLGLGFLFKINPNLHLYTSTEFNNGSPKTKSIKSLFSDHKLRTRENLINFGVRFRLK